MLRRVGVSLLRANLVRSCVTPQRVYTPVLARSMTNSRLCYNQESDDLTKKTQVPDQEELTEQEIEELDEHTRDYLEKKEFMKQYLEEREREDEEAVNEYQRRLEQGAERDLLFEEEFGIIEEDNAQDEIAQKAEEETYFEERELTQEEIAQKAQEEISKQEEIENSTSDDAPWYLRNDEASDLDTTPIFKAEIPEIPKDAPSEVEEILNYATKDLGLDNVKIFDIREMDELPAASYADFMIIVSGKSPKHIQNAVDELVTHLKREYKVIPYVEGLLKANSIKREKRRIKRKVRTSSYIDTEFGVGPNSWVMVDPKIDGVMLHIMTPERRKEVNLELLWCKPEEKEQYTPEVEQPSVQDDVDSIFYGLQRRYYSTRVEANPINTALFQLKESELDELNANLKKMDQEKKREFLQGIVDTIIEMPLSKARTELNKSDNRFIQYYNENFPEEPELRDWKQRYQLYSTLNKLLPSKYPISHLARNLEGQASSGYPISDEQFDLFLDDLLITPEYPTSKITQDELNESFRRKFRYLADILIIKDVQSPFKITPNFLTKLLQLASQDPEGDKSAYSRGFTVILDLFPNISKNDQSVIYLALQIFAEAHEYEPFWKFWNGLTSYKFNGLEVKYDTRPWKVLINVIRNSKNGKLIGDFMEEQVPILINNGVVVDNEMIKDLLYLMNEYGTGSTRYKELVNYLSQEETA